MNLESNYTYRFWRHLLLTYISRIINENKEVTLEMNKFKHILIIDDDEVSTYLTEITIKSEGLAEKVDTALNGEEGLNKLKKSHNHVENGTPELILLDLSMPVLDGFGFLQKFDVLEIGNKPKIVILTSSSNPKDMLRVKEFNILGYLNKPFSADELRHLMDNDN